MCWQLHGEWSPAHELLTEEASRDQEYHPPSYSNLPTPERLPSVTSLSQVPSASSSPGRAALSSSASSRVAAPSSSSAAVSSTLGQPSTFSRPYTGFSFAPLPLLVQTAPGTRAFPTAEQLLFSAFGETEVEEEGQQRIEGQQSAVIQEEGEAEHKDEETAGVYQPLLEEEEKNKEQQQQAERESLPPHLSLPQHVRSQPLLRQPETQLSAAVQREQEEFSQPQQEIQQEEQHPQHDGDEERPAEYKDVPAEIIVDVNERPSPIDTHPHPGTVEDRQVRQEEHDDRGLPYPYAHLHVRTEDEEEAAVERGEGSLALDQARQQEETHMDLEARVSGYFVEDEDAKAMRREHETQVRERGYAVCVRVYLCAFVCISLRTV